MMVASMTIEILNELLALEERHIARRLLESTMFVAESEVEEMELVRRLASSASGHAMALVRLILSLGGEPLPPAPDATSADLHFLTVRHAWSRLQGGIEDTIRRYSQASCRITADPRTSALIARHLADYQESKDEMSRIESAFDLAGRNPRAARPS